MSLQVKVPTGQSSSPQPIAKASIETVPSSPSSVEVPSTESTVGGSLSEVKVKEATVQADLRAAQVHAQLAPSPMENAQQQLGALEECLVTMYFTSEQPPLPQVGGEQLARTEAREAKWTDNLRQLLSSVITLKENLAVRSQEAAENPNLTAAYVSQTALQTQRLLEEGYKLLLNTQKIDHNERTHDLVALHGALEDFCAEKGEFVVIPDNAEQVITPLANFGVTGRYYLRGDASGQMIDTLKTAMAVSKNPDLAAASRLAGQCVETVDTAAQDAIDLFHNLFTSSWVYTEHYQPRLKNDPGRLPTAERQAADLDRRIDAELREIRKDSRLYSLALNRDGLKTAPEEQVLLGTIDDLIRRVDALKEVDVWKGVNETDREFDQRKQERIERLTYVSDYLQVQRGELERTAQAFDLNQPGVEHLRLAELMANVSTTLMTCQTLMEQACNAATADFAAQNSSKVYKKKRNKTGPRHSHSHNLKDLSRKANAVTAKEVGTQLSREAQIHTKRMNGASTSWRYFSKLQGSYEAQAHQRFMRIALMVAAKDAALKVLPREERSRSNPHKYTETDVRNLTSCSRHMIAHSLSTLEESIHTMELVAA